MLDGLIGESEESEENKRAQHDKPPEELEAQDVQGHCSPLDSRNGDNAAKVRVCVFPRNPRVETVLDVDSEDPGRERDGADHLDTREAHEADVARRGEVVIAGEKLLEILATLVEDKDGSHCTRN